MMTKFSIRTFEVMSNPKQKLLTGMEEVTSAIQHCY